MALRDRSLDASLCTSCCEAVLYQGWKWNHQRGTIVGSMVAWSWCSAWRRVRFEGFATIFTFMCPIHYHSLIRISWLMQFRGRILYIFICISKVSKNTYVYVYTFIYIMFMYAHSVPQGTCVKHGYCNTARLNGKMSPALVPRGCSCNGPRPVLPPRPHAYDCSIRTCYFLVKLTYSSLLLLLCSSFYLFSFLAPFLFLYFYVFFPQTGGWGVWREGGQRRCVPEAITIEYCQSLSARLRVFHWFCPFALKGPGRMLL